MARFGTDGEYGQNSDVDNLSKSQLERQRKRYGGNIKINHTELRRL